MHIVILHGYILQGTGSNIYVANLAKAWKTLGHKVTILCQDRNANKLNFVDECITGTPESLTKMKPGTIRVIIPDINELLPVFVKDEYEGYTTKTMNELSEEEIKTHIDLVSSCLKKIISSEKVDLVFANHAILNPAIARKAIEGTDIPYDIKIHGSAIEFSLVPFPYLMTYALYGLENARHVIAGTEHVKHRVLQVFNNYLDKLNLYYKIKIVPPGMDPDIFKISDSFIKTKQLFLERVKLKIENCPNGRNREKMLDLKPDRTTLLDEYLNNIGKKYDQRAPDSDIIKKISTINEDSKIVFYFGKFLKTKGVGELLAIALKLIKENPDIIFIFSGFGTYREHMEELIKSFEIGNLEYAKKVAESGDFISEINIEDYFQKLSPGESSRIVITGFLDHDTLPLLLSLAQLCIVPSKLAEAFGMVAIESMACGVAPICNNHSGLSDIINELADSLPEIAQQVKTDQKTFFCELGKKIIAVKSFLEKNDNNRIKNDLRCFSVKNYSWVKIAKTLLE